jgi:putative PIN family toxin of toxin-antitoxin system
MTRIVLDTNVLVSAMLSGKGNEAMVLRLARAGTFTVCFSAEILEEYESVLRRPGFRLPAASIDQLLQFLRAEGIAVTPAITVTASPDDPDNRFLECAEAADAEYLVTGNKRHFPKEWKRTMIVNARELLLEALFL